MEDFLWRALLGGVGIALIAGPLGCFIVWRRMAYFGDTLAHSALLGIALGFLWGLDLKLSTLIVSLTLAALLILLQQQKRLATDTSLGILAHSALALSLVILAFIPGLRIDLSAYLFGDLLAVNRLDLYWIYAGGLVLLGLLLFMWQALLAITLHEELAQVEGIPVLRTKALFMLSVALVVAIAMKIVGILLITSLLIIPPAVARRFSHTPEQMALLASLVGCLAVIMGLSLSWYWDTPASPSIVVSATLLFILAWSL